MGVLLRAEIISVGRELLIGKVANTNAQWLANRIVRLGGRVERVTVVDDEVGVIASALREARKRGAKFIITTGGLGPTFDDRTLEGVATAFSQRLTPHPEALKMIKARYAQMSQKAAKVFTLTRARKKMAFLPSGGQPLRNPVGTAPGCLLEAEGCCVVSLPGVPREMKAIFKQAVEPYLTRKFRLRVYGESVVLVEGVSESTVAPKVSAVMAKCPPVYVKSLPKGREGRPRIELHLSVNASDGGEASRLIQRASRLLARKLRALDGAVRLGKPKTYKRRAWGEQP